jgi:hypothetical protein
VQDFTVTSRPVHKVYLNFDKDIAARMFGYRTRFNFERLDPKKSISDYLDDKINEQ